MGKFCSLSLLFYYFSLPELDIERELVKRGYIDSISFSQNEFAVFDIETLEVACSGDAGESDLTLVSIAVCDTMTRVEWFNAIESSQRAGEKQKLGFTLSFSIYKNLVDAFMEHLNGLHAAYLERHWSHARFAAGDEELSAEIKMTYNPLKKRFVFSIFFFINDLGSCCGFDIF